MDHPSLLDPRAAPATLSPPRHTPLPRRAADHGSRPARMMQARAAMTPKHCWPALLLLVATPARAVEGRAYLAFDGQAALARGEMSRLVLGLTPGWDFRFGAGIRGIPLTVGLGAGALSYSSQSF